ncbi:MAG: sugar transferase [Proteiniphilum sp.]
MSIKYKNIYRAYVKRALDITITILFLAFFWWVYLLLAILVKKNLGSPIIFKQERIGMNEKPFIMYKFRTMNNAVDDFGNLLPDEKRLTKFGLFLRSTSMDELPELWNVLCGTMSLVGPRPLLEKYLPYYTEYENHRHDVLPGITGYAQVHGRNYVTWEDKFRMDVKYTKEISLKTDFGILWKTAQIVLRRDNVDTGSFIEKDGVIYRPLDVERAGKRGST